MKTCNRCGEHLPLGSFRPHEVVGFFSICRQCEKETADVDITEAQIDAMLRLHVPVKQPASNSRLRAKLRARYGN